MEKNDKEEEKKALIVTEKKPPVPSKGAALVRFFPGAITIAAFCVGFSSIKFALFHKWELAVFCIFVAALLDALDGKVARMFGQSSQFGAQLDSLSDLVCFGVAPAVVLFLRSEHLLDAGWGACMFFTVCCALRLARYNADMLQSENQPEWERKFFKGVPAPAGAILALFPLVLSFFLGDRVAFGYILLPLHPKFIFFCLAISGMLMISSIRTFSSKVMEVNAGRLPIALLAVSLIIICLITEVWLTLVLLIALYLFLIPYGAYKYSQMKTDDAPRTDPAQ